MNGWSHLKLKPLPIVILVLFAFSLASALLFLCYPVVPFPKGDPVCGASVAICLKETEVFNAQNLRAQASFMDHQYALWGFVGFAAVGAVLSLHLLRSRPDRPRLTALAGLFILTPYMVFASLYLFMLGMDYGFLTGSVTIYSLSSLAPLGAMANYGTLTLFYFAAASACLTVFFLGRGLLHAFVRALRVFAVPGILLLEFIVLKWDYQEMPVHVTSFASWQIGGIYVLSNWTVLAVASVLAVALYVPPAFRLAHFRRGDSERVLV